MAHALTFRKHPGLTPGVPDFSVIWLALIVAALVLIHYAVLNFLARLVNR